MAFAQEVYRIVNSIPEGKVLSYGNVALIAGKPRAARLVGWILSQDNIGSLPWHRVVNKNGIITIDNSDHPKVEQAHLLQQEGVEVEKRDETYYIDMEKYGWNIS